MLMLWTRYPRDQHSLTRNLIATHGIGAVIPADAWWLYEDLNPDTPRWDYIDERIDSLPGNHPIHIHPVLNRGPHANWLAMDGQLDRFVYPVLERYGDRVTRFTIANELLLKGSGVRQQFIDLFRRLGHDFPNLKLWVGEYGLRSNQRVRGAEGIIETIHEIQSVADNFEGLIVIDYLDLTKTSSSSAVLGIKNLFHVPGRYLIEDEPVTIPGWLQALEQHSKTIVISGKLAANLKEIQLTEAKVALETSVYTGPNPTARVVAEQAYAYRRLKQMCEDVGGEFWQWNLCDESASMAWDVGRAASDCPGWFDRDGVLKDWAGELLECLN